MGWSGLIFPLQVQLATMTDQQNPADMTGTNALVVGIPTSTLTPSHCQELEGRGGKPIVHPSAQEEMELVSAKQWLP